MALNTRSRVAVSLLGLSTLLFCWYLYSINAYHPAMLTLQAKTKQKSSVYVAVEGFDEHERYLSRLDIIDDDGNDMVYELELPSVRLKSITVPPLAAKDMFTIDALTLSNDVTRYTWTDTRRCRQHTHENTMIEDVPCRSGSPNMVKTTDSSVVISSIPEKGFIKERKTRIMFSAPFAIMFFFGGLWFLYRPSDESVPTNSIRYYAVRSLWLLLGGLYIYQLYQICRYAVDVPYHDEWFFFSEQALPNGLSLRWLFGFFMEHMIVTTKIISWLNLQLFDLDYIIQMILNYFIFGWLLFAIVQIKNKVLGKEDFAFFPAFMLFLVSMVAYENHAWPFQIQMHFALLFSVLSLLSFDSSCKSYVAELTFCAYCVLGIFSFAAGVVFSLVYLALKFFFVVAGMVRKQIPHLRGILTIVLNMSIIGIATAFWLHEYRHPTSDPHLVLPVKFAFWDYFFNLLSLGFGFTEENPLPGLACLILVILPVFVLAARKETRWQSATWLVMIAIVGILAVLAAISAGRAGAADYYRPKYSRYSEISFLLIPYGALAWWLALQAKRWRNVALMLFWCFCFVPYYHYNLWSLDIYAQLKQEKIYTLECAEHYYAGIGDGKCEGIPSPPLLDAARELEVKFTRKIGSRGLEGIFFK